jgi:hypothetical protein
MSTAWIVVLYTFALRALNCFVRLFRPAARDRVGATEEAALDPYVECLGGKADVCGGFFSAECADRHKCGIVSAQHT